MTESIATYHTRTGLVALEVKKHTAHDGRITYGYNGKHGAGSGHDLSHVKRGLRVMLESHKGIKLVAGADLLSI